VVNVQAVVGMPALDLRQRLGVEIRVIEADLPMLGNELASLTPARKNCEAYLAANPASLEVVESINKRYLADLRAESRKAIKAQTASGLPRDIGKLLGPLNEWLPELGEPVGHTQLQGFRTPHGPCSNHSRAAAKLRSPQKPSSPARPSIPPSARRSSDWRPKRDKAEAAGYRSGMKPISTSTYTFSSLIEGGYLYVHKTAQIHRLIAEAKGQFFLSRPRRFGKSLLISTIKAIFQGRRELFDGLAIADSDYEWQDYPVIHLDMGSSQAKDPAELNYRLNFNLDRQAKAHGVTLSEENADLRFRELVDLLAERGKVVILVDEYDKPLLNHLNADSAPAIQSLLKSFYSVIKTTESQQRFVLLTGISKFTRVSIFSDLNNLSDLTMNEQAATLLGYTQEELEDNFADYIDRLAQREGCEPNEILRQLREWYNGYRFERRSETVYNPVSVMKCLAEQEFKNFWFETTTPTFLINLLKERPVDLSNLATSPLSDASFSTYDARDLQPLPLLVQTGYLTILSAERIGGQLMYYLGYPNQEVAWSFSRWLAQAYCEVENAEFDGAVLRLLRAFEADDLDTVRDQLRVFFASVPYTIQLTNEKYYQTIFFVIFKLLGAAIRCEVCTNVGRIDATVETDTQVYIFEFKMSGDAEKALEQIRDRKYWEQFENSGKTITLVGAAFDAEKRNIEGWITEPLSAEP
jgi:hypothetical protein